MNEKEQLEKDCGSGKRTGSDHGMSDRMRRR